jgi:ABC-type dipeptide/oligopeptide/nickel transport system permease subunit
VLDQEPDNLQERDDAFTGYGDEPDGPSWGMRVVIIITVIAMVLTVSWWIVLPPE